MLSQNVEVNFTDPLLWLLALGVPALSAVVFWLGSILTDWVKRNTPFGVLVTDQLVREALQGAINFGIGYATQKIKESNATVTFDNAFIGSVVQYVTERVPDALEHFGINATALEAMVKARLGLLHPEVAALPK